MIFHHSRQARITAQIQLGFRFCAVAGNAVGFEKWTHRLRSSPGSGSAAETSGPAVQRATIAARQGFMGYLACMQEAFGFIRSADRQGVGRGVACGSGRC